MSANAKSKSAKKSIAKTCTAADILINRLIDWKVEIIFGLPGDGINGIMEALRKNKDKIRFIQVRHEEAAALMACGYAKFTGKLGVCLATTGPGAIHLLNGLYDAKMDNAPVLAITGQTYHDLIGAHYQQEVDLLKAEIEPALKQALQSNKPAVVEAIVDSNILPLPPILTAMQRKNLKKAKLK